MQNGPFSIAVDVSNDSGIEKMNPLTVKIFDTNQGVVSTQFLDMHWEKSDISCYRIANVHMADI